MVAKAGLGIIGLSAISVGGVALAKPGWLGMGGDPMPKWHSLSEDNGFSDSTYSSGKFANKLTKYLVGVTNKKDGQTSDTNQFWWEWSFRRLKADNPRKGKFKYNDGTGANVEIAYDNSNQTPNAKALNQVCKSSYETEITSGFTTEEDETKFKKSDVWKYCSPGKLTTTSGDTGNDAYGGNTIGGGTDKTSLVSVKNSANDWFWEIRNKDFWATSGDWSGSGASGNNGNKSIFKKEYEEKSSSTDGTKKTIKELCKEAYTQQANPDSNNNNKDAKKFCVLEAATA